MARSFVAIERQDQVSIEVDIDAGCVLISQGSPFEAEPNLIIVSQDNIKRLISALEDAMRDFA